MNIRLPPMQFPDLTDSQMTVIISLFVFLALLLVLGAIGVKWLCTDEK